MHLALIIAPAIFAAYTIIESLANRRRKSLPDLLSAEEIANLERAEEMREIIQSWTGREPSAVKVVGGKWHAQICERWVTVSELLGERLTMKKDSISDVAVIERA